MNCEGDEGPAVTMFGGIPAFGGHGLGGSIEKSATLTAKDTRMDIESETFFVQLDQDFACTLGAKHGNVKAEHAWTQPRPREHHPRLHLRGSWRRRRFALAYPASNESQRQSCKCLRPSCRVHNR
jgi:hypothetical protein